MTAAGLALAGVFLVAALVAAFLPAEVRHGVWLPLHLTLAGGAATAIAAALPFFASSLLSARPAPFGGRVLSLVLVAGGAIAVAAGVAGGQTGAPDAVAPLGGMAFVAGIVALTWTTFRPLRGSLGPRHVLVIGAYAVALGDVAVGATLATLYVGGYAPVVAAWVSLKPVHAWLNLLGFVSLVIAGTLVHLYPTVLGTRIPARPTTAGRAARAMVWCLAAGPPAVAAGYWLRSDVLVWLGALAEVAGAAALVTYAAAIWRGRGRWTTDRGWHWASIGHLSGAIAWLAAGMLVAAWQPLAAGADPAGWSVDAVLAPLVVGCAAQAVVGAWTHLLPSIGPGDAVLHARQRVTLASGARIRVAAYQLGTLGLAFGLGTGSAALTFAGTALVAAAGLGGLGLLFGGLGRGHGLRALHDPLQRR